MIKRTGALVLVLAGALAAAGCTSTPAGRGAAIGGATGAVVGGVASGSWGGAAVGAGVGAVAGAIIADSRGRCYRVNANGTRTRVNCPR